MKHLALLATLVALLDAPSSALATRSHVDATSSTPPAWPLPQAVALPPAIEAPRDTPYPGTIRLEVDATDVARRIHRIHEHIPVSGPQALTLLFPQWMPGDHAPTGAIDQLAGLVITAGGKTLKWTRDTVQVHAFHVDVPAGVRAIDLAYQFLVPADEKVGPVLLTPTMLDLQWQSLVLYPAGHYARRITVEPSVTLPAGWMFASALDGAQRVGDVVRFAPVTLDALIDSPLMAGRWMKRLSLGESPVPVHLDLAADKESDLAVPAEAIDLYRQAVAQAYALFGSRHYDHYDLMIWLSNDFGPTYFEQHRSSENRMPAAFFADWNKYERYAGVPLHGFVHSWNGLFRTPAPMWTANFNVPQQDTLLWVFEGLTVYWNDVLDARSGIAGTQDALASFERTAADLATRPGTQWRTLQDASNEQVIQHGNGNIFPEGRRQSWPDWQLGASDPYDQGELIWLDADTLIRQRTGGRKSLDDFARGFFGVRDGSWVAFTYTFDDLVAGLNDVLPYDWARFLRARADAVGDLPRLDGIERGGYRLVYTDQQSPAAYDAEQRRGTADLRFSLGMTVDKDGAITDVVWDGPAFQAGLGAGAKILAVDGTPFTAAALKAAVTSARDGGKLHLLVSRGAAEQALDVSWSGGLRYPHLQRIPGAPALLDDILTPRH